MSPERGQKNSSKLLCSPNLVSCVGFAAGRPRMHADLIRDLLAIMIDAFGDCTAHVKWIAHPEEGEDGHEPTGSFAVEGKSPATCKAKSATAWVQEHADELASSYCVDFQVMLRSGYKAGRPVRWALYYHDRMAPWKFRTDARISVHIDAALFAAEYRKSPFRLLSDITRVFSEYPEVHQGFIEAGHRSDSWDGDFYSAAPSWPISLVKLKEMWEWQRAGNITRKYVRADTWGIYVGPGLAAKVDPKRDVVERFNDRFFPSGKREHDAVRHPSGALTFYCTESPVDQLGGNYASSETLVENLTWIRDRLRETDTLWHLGLSRHDPMNDCGPYDINSFLESAQIRLRRGTRLRPGMRQALEAAGFHVPADHPEYPAESMKPKPKKRAKRANSPKSPPKKKTGRKQ